MRKYPPPPDLHPDTEKFEKEMFFYQRHRDSFYTQFIPRAFWGTILSRQHIERLGGEERIRQEAECYQIEWWGENLLLQLTPSPCDVSPEQFSRLNNFLSPIRLPDAPTPIYKDHRDYCRAKHLS
jgi:hypothetical protein